MLFEWQIYNRISPFEEKHIFTKIQYLYHVIIGDKIPRVLKIVRERGREREHVMTNMSFDSSVIFTIDIYF